MVTGHGSFRDRLYNLGLVDDEIVKIEEGLGIGSRMSPVLAEILMKRWEKEKIDTEIRIRKFRRYVDDSIGIWKGEKEKIDTEIRIRKFRRYVDDSIGIWKGGKDILEEKVKEMEDERKSIKLKLEVEKERRITFLDIEIGGGGKKELQ